MSMDRDKLKTALKWGVGIPILIVIIWFLYQREKEEFVWLDEYECFIAVGYDCSTCVIGGSDYRKDLIRCDNALEKLDRGEKVEIRVDYFTDPEMPVYGHIIPKE